MAIGSTLPLHTHDVYGEEYRQACADQAVNSATDGMVGVMPDITDILKTLEANAIWFGLSDFQKGF